LASLWEFVTPLVARLPISRCDAIAFETWVIDSSLDRMSFESRSWITMNVCLSRSDRATARPEQGLSITIVIPGAGRAKVMLLALAELTSTVPWRQRRMSLAMPFLASASCPSLPGCWMVSVLKDGCTVEDSTG
jgi:hypothetical protein